MATPAGLSVVDGPTTAPGATSAGPTVEVTLPVERRHHGKLLHETHTFTAYARTEGGSMMKIASGQNVYAGLQAFLVARLLDDDGVPHEAVPRLIAEGELEWPDDEDGPEDDGDDAGAIPGDAALGKLRKSELVALCETHELGTDGTNADLVKALTNKRDADTGAAVAVPDDELVDDERRWRLVWPDDVTGAPGSVPVLDRDGDDYGPFDSLGELRAFARSHGSSLRRFVAIVDEPLETFDTDGIDAMAQQIIEGAARRPTQPPKGSRRSRPGRARSRR